MQILPPLIALLGYKAVNIRKNLPQLPFPPIFYHSKMYKKGGTKKIVLLREVFQGGNMPTIVKR